MDQKIKYGTGVSRWFFRLVHFFIHFSFGTAQKRISLSWHLTKREVQILTNAIDNPQNQKELKRLKALMASMN